MEARQITIFGGSGFLGRYVVRALAKKGWRIKVATRRPNRAFFLRPMGQVGQIGFIKCDVADAGQISHAMAGSHAVVNLTGISRRNRGIANLCGPNDYGYRRPTLNSGVSRNADPSRNPGRVGTQKR